MSCHAATSPYSRAGLRVSWQGSARVECVYRRWWHGGFSPHMDGCMTLILSLSFVEGTENQTFIFAFKCGLILIIIIVLTT